MCNALEMCVIIHLKHKFKIQQKNKIVPSVYALYLTY
jgi:myosin-crossreactive antigen